MLQHRLADGRDHLAAQNDVLLDSGVAEVKIAVFQTLCFVRLAAAVDLKGKLVVAAAAKNRDLLGDDLDVTGRDVRILAGTLSDRADDTDGGFLVDSLQLTEQVLIFYNQLRFAVEVTDHNEGQAAADLADVLHPAGKLYFLADMLHPELSTGMCTGLHICFLLM